MLNALSFFAAGLCFAGITTAILEKRTLALVFNLAFLVINLGFGLTGIGVLTWNG